MTIVNDLPRESFSSFSFFGLTRSREVKYEKSAPAITNTPITAAASGKPRLGFIMSPLVSTPENIRTKGQHSTLAKTPPRLAPPEVYVFMLMRSIPSEVASIGMAYDGRRKNVVKE
ncbi:hypothetical protein SDC9_106265 [bioreactor metagenome]|uniref:Uncharacterized protein n=1 Tax=bioreactor metagenome TaxID=1076179 RepID=A0A645B8D7_9ZZZZ